MDAFNINTCVYTNGSGLISDDLLIEILRRLPFKSLARFRCVSKAWYYLISDPRFRTMLASPMIGLFYQKWDINEGQIGYTTVSNYETFGIMAMTQFSATDFSLKFLPDYSQLKFMDCCNGLLLFLHGSDSGRRRPVRRRRGYAGRDHLTDIPDRPDVFYVCNPMTRRWSRLPECPSTNRLIFDSVLLFDPCTGSTHFKVIRICCVSKTCLDMTTFDSKTRSWIKYSDVMTAEPRPCRPTTRGIVNSPDGVVYRLGHPQRLLRIDLLNDQKVTTIELPEGWCRVPCFGLYDGNVHCALFRQGHQLRVWELKEYSLGASTTHEWVLKHNNSCLEILLQQKFGWLGRTRLLAFHLLLKVIYIGIFNRIVSYNFGNETLEECCTFWEQHHLMGDLKTHPYVPCFLDSLDEAEIKEISVNY